MKIFRKYLDEIETIVELVLTVALIVLCCNMTCANYKSIMGIVMGLGCAVVFWPELCDRLEDARDD